MRTTIVATVLLAVLGGCGGDTGAEPPPTTAAVPTTTTTTTPAAAPASERLDECPEVAIEPGRDGVAWMAATDDPWGFTTLTVAVDDGFAIGTEECVTVVDADGDRRWSRLTGHVLDSTQTADRIVVLTTPTRPQGAILTAYDAATGHTLWEDTATTGAWTSVISIDDVVVLTGTGDGALVATFDAATGEGLQTRTGRAGAAPVFPLAHPQWVILGGTDRSDGRLLAVDATGTLVVDRGVDPRYPVPVAAVGAIVVLQASGIDDDTDDVEPPTFLAAHDLVSGEERWRLALEGTHAERAVQVGHLVVMSTNEGVTAVDIDSGTARWSTASLIEQPATIAPLGDDAVAIAAADGTLQVVEIASGERRWQRSVAGVTRLLGTADGDLLVVDGEGRYELVDPHDGRVLWSATGPVPTRRDTGPNHHEMVASDGVYVTIGCPVPLDQCERTDQRVVAIRPVA